MAKNPIRIMALDDDPTFLSALYDFLTKAGYELYPFGNPGTAWELLSVLVPDALLLDLNMPMLDGREFLPWARKQCPEMKIIICTGLEVHLSNSIFKESGIRHILRKPVTPAEVIQTLEKAFQESRPGS